MNQYDLIFDTEEKYNEYCEQQAFLAEPFFIDAGLLSVEVCFNRYTTGLNDEKIKDPYFTWTVSTPHDPDAWYSGAMYLYSQDSYYSPEEAFEAGKEAAAEWLKEALSELGVHMKELY